MPFKHFEVLKDFFKGIGQLMINKFPIKLQIPLFMSVNTMIEFQNFNFTDKPALSLFTIDEIIAKQYVPQFEQRQAQQPLQPQPDLRNLQYPNLLESFREEEGSEVLAEASQQFREMINEGEDYIENLLDETQRTARRRQESEARLQQEQAQQAPGEPLSAQQVRVALPPGQQANFHRKKQESCDLNFLELQEQSEFTDEKVVPKVKVFSTNLNANGVAARAQQPEQKPPADLDRSRGAEDAQIDKLSQQDIRLGTPPTQEPAVQMQYNIYKQSRQKQRAARKDSSQDIDYKEFFSQQNIQKLTAQLYPLPGQSQKPQAPQQQYCDQEDTHRKNTSQSQSLENLQAPTLPHNLGSAASQSQPIKKV